ncbi:hypothetical protein Megvenef_01044 [Candidatus Megaera venefica]|uniref:Uncharacterized protein n=1 Tax=Candidatus Megaera venefica TaxID=2055910 RepID=A0ABU5ND16_9RICK|nr:hypothetical protein [Candidatus Megaera venefica]
MNTTTIIKLFSSKVLIKIMIVATGNTMYISIVGTFLNKGTKLDFIFSLVIIWDSEPKI